MCTRAGWNTQESIELPRKALLLDKEVSKVAVRTRIDVAKEVAPKFGVTLQDADRFVLLVLNEIKAILKRGDEVAFRGFGFLPYGVSPEG